MYIEYNFAAEEVLVYLRKSRSDDVLLTVEEVLQKHETILDEWSVHHLGTVVSEENKYREIVSGETIDDRPQIKEVLKRIESPRIKAILVVEVQRLSRGDLEDAGRLIKLLRYTNTFVITPQKTYNLNDEYDRDIFERELKRGNEFLEYQKKIMNRGRLLSVQQGNYIGSVAPYGYDRIMLTEGKRKCPTLKINETEANVVRMIFDLYVNSDYGFKKIANRLDELGIKPRNCSYWSPPALKDMVSNIHYIGKVKWNRRKTVTIVEDGEILKTRPKQKIGDFLICDGKHEAIISEELFNAAQAKQGRSNRARPNSELRNPFASILYCSCGRSMSLKYFKDKNGNERAAPRLSCDNQTNCHTGSCLYSEMIDLTKNILLQNIEDFEVHINENNRNQEKLHKNLIKQLEKRIDELNQKEISLWDKYSDEDMPKHIFDSLNDKLQNEREEVSKSLIIAKNNAPSTATYEEKLHRFKNALDLLEDETVTVEEKNKLLKTCFERITYTRAAPQRLKRKPAEKKGERLIVGGNWSYSPIELDVKLKI